MIYCSLEDAWGKSNDINYPDSIKQESCKNNLPKLNSSIECFTNSEMSCQLIIDHINSCESCYSKINKKSRLMNIINSLVDEYRDTLILILLGIFIVLFINLITNITKN